jgi:hypothetical protein
VWRPQELLNIRFDQAESDVTVELLAPIIHHEAWTAFYPHLVSIVVVRIQAGECGTVVNALFDSSDVGTEGFGYLTLNIPARNVPAVSKKCTAESPKHLIENAL